MTPLDGPERRRAFCARLKSERERRGTSLRAIAESTKVKASLLEALERGDVSRWPKGIYRRSFFRDYVAAFGLPSERYAAEFLELFPDGEELPASVAARSAPIAPAPALTGPATPSALRLTLAPEVPGWRLAFRGAPPLLARAQPLAAVLDLLVVIALAAAIAATGVAGIERAAAAVACLYFTVGTAVTGRSPGSSFLARYARARPLQAGTQTEPSAAARPVATPSRLSVFAGQALRATSTVRDFAAQLSHAASITVTSERKRDLTQLRRRRVETANRAVDEAI